MHRPRGEPEGRAQGQGRGTASPSTCPRWSTGTPHRAQHTGQGMRRGTAHSTQAQGHTAGHSTGTTQGQWWGMSANRPGGHLTQGHRGRARGISTGCKNEKSGGSFESSQPLKKCLDQAPLGGTAHRGRHSEDYSRLDGVTEVNLCHTEGVGGAGPPHVTKGITQCRTSLARQPP